MSCSSTSSSRSAARARMSEFLALISPETLDPAPFEEFVLTPENGALVTFRGILEECCRQVATATGLRVAAAHRVGSLVVGDTALVATVAAPHRAEAFAACEQLVELIKREVPIWKRQHLADGATEWVGL